MTGIGEALEREWQHLRHHHASAAQAAATATIESTAKENPVNLLEEIETGIHDVAAKFQAVDKAALGAVENIKNDPVRYSIFVSLANSAHVPDPAGILGSIDNLLKAFAGPAAVPPAEPAFTPAGPQVAGQA